MDNTNMEKMMESVDLSNFVYKNRLTTFERKWPYDKQEGANCTSEKMAEAGFVCTATKSDPEAASCFVCQHEMLWDPDDDPMGEHIRHRADCELVKLNKPEEEYTVRDVLRLVAYVYSTKMYPNIVDSVSNLQALMDKLVANTEKMLTR